MATFQLGPEKPRPFSVLTEGHIRQQIDIPYLPQHERYSFGEEYEMKMCELIHKYLELDTDNSLCYVGDPKGSLVPLLQNRFCLLKPVTTVIPGHIHYEESPNHHMLPIKVANVGADDFFRRESEGAEPQMFDKILLKDAVPFLDDFEATFNNIQKCLAPGGKMLIIHRSAPINSLPLFNEAKERFHQYDQAYENLIQQLARCGLDVTWDIDCLPVKMPKDKWYAMLHEKFPSELEMVSNYEVRLGLRELSEGMFKYGDHPVAFTDQLLFVTVSKAKEKTQAEVKRYKEARTIPLKPTPTENPVKFTMEVTPDMMPFVRARQREGTKPRPTKCSLFN